MPEAHREAAAALFSLAMVVVWGRCGSEGQETRESAGLPPKGLEEGEGRMPESSPEGWCPILPSRLLLHRVYMALHVPPQDWERLEQMSLCCQVRHACRGQSCNAHGTSRTTWLHTSPLHSWISLRSLYSRAGGRCPRSGQRGLPKGTTRGRWAQG